MREWLVIESVRKHSVFAPDGADKPKGYVPRDAAEKLLGRDLGKTVWFTPEECKALRTCPEWTVDMPPDRPEDVPSLLYLSLFLMGVGTLLIFVGLYLLAHVATGVTH
jgi:hypothetical protein